MNTGPIRKAAFAAILASVAALPLTSACSQPAPAVEMAGVTINPDMNTLEVDAAGTITWNGAPISIEQLEDLLGETARMDQEPALQFLPDPASSYELSANILRVIQRSGITKFGFVGNEKYRVYEPGD